MGNNFILSIFAILLLGACSQDYKTAQQDSLVLEKMSDIEDETITRMSFVDRKDEYDNVEVVLYQDDSDLNRIMPASGDVSNNENNPDK